MSEVKNVLIDSIESNPHRSLKKYPFVDRKVDALMRSIKDVGLWEGVIARKRGSKYEIAFGHHRVEAARKCKLSKIALIVRDLSDEQMLQFMGRENMEDYNADFLVMLETWEAAAAFIAGARPEKSQPIDVSRLIGWTSSERGSKAGDRMNETARACNAAAQLVAAGYHSRSEYEGLTVFAVREITTRELERHNRIEKLAKQSGRTDAETKVAKRQYSKGATLAAKEVKAGRIATKDVRAEVDYRAHTVASKSKTKSPLAIAVAVKEMCRNIGKMVNTDATGAKLAEIEKHLKLIMTDETGPDSLRRLHFELKELVERAKDWRARIQPKTGNKITPANLIAMDGGR